MREKVLSSAIAKFIAFGAGVASAVFAFNRLVYIILYYEMYGPGSKADSLITPKFWHISGAALIFVACFVFLCCASGHRKEGEPAKPGWATNLPLDLVTAVSAAIVIGAFTGGAGFRFGLMDISENRYLLYPLYLITAVTASCFLGLSMSVALRIKLGDFWKNTLVYRLLVFMWNMARGCLSLMGRFLRFLGSFIAQLSLVWKAAVAAVVIGILEIFIVFGLGDTVDGYVRLWLWEKVIFIPAVLYVLIIMRRLQKGASAIAEGMEGYKLDTAGMFWDFKKHAEDLNSISEGVSAAVEEKLRSERMKTELITNVSHDIKTPLTSIINYADLIGRDDCKEEDIKEYSQVLLRQSERLKKLLQDLLEASKASSGNLDIDLVPLDAAMLVSQAEGEYGERLASTNLSLMVKTPKKPVYIMADSRRIWRVMDNLMDNICKYAQEGTRVYISLERDEAEKLAVISLRNTSRDALNISPEELMERFVRGDESRSTQGSGLGLSIAASFTELMGGHMKVEIDADLFKVNLSFKEL